MIKDFIESVGVAVAALVLAAILTVVCGVGGLAYKHYIGRADANIERDIFENSKSYVSGMVSDLAEHEKELRETEDKTERAAIIDFINEKFANFDETKIDNGYLREFLEDIRRGDVE